MHLSTLVEIAADIRRRAEQSEPAFSTQQIVAACFPDALVTGRVLPPGILEAVSRTDDGPVILYSRNATPAEQRFAIAHALAHLLFDDDRAFRQPGQDRDPEVESRADAFADELLVPLSELAPYVCRAPSEDRIEHDIYLDMVDQIASHFAVMPSVIDRRIRQLMTC